MRKLLGLALILALLVPFAVQAQDCPAQLGADDCALFQSGVSGLEAIQSFTGNLELTSSTSAMGMIDVSFTGSGTIRASVGADGNLAAAEVYLPAASLENGGFMGMGGTAQESAIGLIYVDNSFYVGTGAANTPLESLTWQSTPGAVPLGIRQGFPTNYFANVPSVNAAWIREATIPMPSGTEAVVFSAATTDQADAMQALALLGGAMTGTTGSIDPSAVTSDMLGDMSSMFEGVTGTAENSAQLLVTLDGQPAGFGISQTVTADLANMFGGLTGTDGQTGTDLGDLDLGGLLGDSGMGYSVVNQYMVQFSSLNQPVSIAAPAVSTPLESTSASLLSGFGAGGLFAVINSYFSQQGLQNLASDPNALLGQLGNTGDLGNLLGNLTTSDATRVDRGVIEPGQTINGALEAGTSDTYTFTAPEGTGVVIAMNADFDTYLELENANGEQIAYNDDFDGLNSQISTSLPGAGQYTIIARSFGDFSNGPYTLSLEFVQVTVGGGDIAYGQTVNATRIPNQDDNYTFTGNAGDAVEILLVSDNYDTYLELRGPDGVVVAQDDDGAGNLDSLISTTLPASGEYTIVARAFSEGDSGAYTLTLTSSSAAPAPTVPPVGPTSTPTLPPLPTKPPTGSDTTAPTSVPPTSSDGQLRQWASSAEATSEYSSNGWDAGQTVGEPDSPGCGDYSTAWASSLSTEVASLTVMFDTPVIATEVNIHQTYTPGSIVSIELVLESEDTVEVPDSADPVGNTECPGIFTVDVSGVSAEPVVGVIIHLDQTIGGDWNEIDAVELVGTAS